jgi:hypothetical protein
MTLEAPRVAAVVDKQGMVTKPWLAWFKSVLIHAAGKIGGSGTAGTIPKFDTSTTLTDSIITEASSKISLASGTDIDEFSTDGTMAGESDDAVPTEQAVVEYLRSKKVDWDETAHTVDSNGNISEILYKRSSVTKVTETRTYNAYMNVSTIVLSGEISGTWTYSYDTDNQTLTGVART